MSCVRPILKDGFIILKKILTIKLCIVDAMNVALNLLKLVKTEPKFKYNVTEVDIKKVPANDEMPLTLYFEPLK